MLEPVMFTGGLYKHDLVVELVEDLGGYVLQKNVTQTEIILLILVPTEDMAILQAMAKELRGELVRAPLAGTEVAVVTPTLAIHHLPHSACDIAEYLRRHGSKTNMLGLARGVGREIAQINEYETALINEHDAAVFIFGNFQECIKKKESLALNLTGVRVKLPYDAYKDAVKAVTFDEGVSLGEIATIKPSRMKDYILVRILSASETGFVF